MGPLHLIDSVLSLLNDSLLLMHELVMLRSAVQLFILRLPHTEEYFYPIWQQVGTHKDNDKEEIITVSVTICLNLQI